jgi:uncharacterized protein (TIGR03437 family)
MLKLMAHCCVFLVLSAPLAFAETVTLRSGSGNAGNRDSSISFLLGPANSDFSKAFTQSDFSTAQSGPAAFILNRNPLWISGLSVDAAAKWIGTNSNASSQGKSALYAVNFTISSAFSSATLTLHYAVDDALGGVYLNGIAVCKNLIANSITNFTQEHTLDCNDVGAALKVGSNWIFIDASNSGAAAGLLFAATINTTAVSILSIGTGGVVNAASNALGAVAPGTIAAATGNFLLGSPSIAPSGQPWPTCLAGLSMQFGGIPAPLYYASAAQVNFQVPWELEGRTQAAVSATVGTQTGRAQIINLSPYSPGLFSMNSQGSGQGAILDSRYRLVDSSNPASVGDVIQIYSTGLGAVTNQPASGSPAPSSPLAETTTTPVATIGGTTAHVLYSGLTPGSVGLYQVNAQVPTGIATSPAVPVVVSIGGVASNTVTMAIQPFPPNPQPSIATVSPPSATVGDSPLVLTITGGGFLALSTVTFNRLPHAASLVSSSQLTIALNPADLAISGTFSVLVTNSPPGGGNSNPMNFSVTARPPSPSYTVLHSFSGADGAKPQASLIQANDGSFWGTTGAGGNLGCITGLGDQGCGVVFKMDSSGRISVVHAFSGYDGNSPNSTLIQAPDASFYGTTWWGASPSCGTPGVSYGPGCGAIFKMSTFGDTSVVHSFSGKDGRVPSALIQANGRFYGTTKAGGADEGTAFSLSFLPSGLANLTLLVSFGTAASGGIWPNALIQASDGYFYGTTEGVWTGGATVFRMDASGNVTTLHSFTSADGMLLNGLIQGRDGGLYGTAQNGGATGLGTIFRIDAAGNFRVLHSFSGADGSMPTALLQASDGFFYGTTQGGGLSSCAGTVFGAGECANGAIFRMGVGGNVTILHVLSGLDGSGPNGMIQGTDGNLYGTTMGGGATNCGVVFRISDL